MANVRVDQLPVERWILLSLCLAAFVAACFAFLADVYTKAISEYLQEHPTPLHPPSWIFSPWLWVPLMLQHGLVFKLLYGPDRPFEMPRRELLICFMREYGDLWTLGFACEAFVAVFINAAATPFSSVPEPLVSGLIAAATAEAAFCFVYTSLNSKAYAVMTAMSNAQANGDHPLFGAREFAPNYASMVGLAEMVGSIHAAVLCALVPCTLQAALSDSEDPNWVLAWVLFFVVLAGGLATTIRGNCIFGLVLFYLLCWFPLLRTFKKHHMEIGGGGLRAVQRFVLLLVGGGEGGVAQHAQQLEHTQAQALADTPVASIVGVVVLVAVIAQVRRQQWGGWAGGSRALRALARMHDSDIEHAMDQEAVLDPAPQHEEQASVTQPLLPASDTESEVVACAALLHDDIEDAGRMHSIELLDSESDIL